MPDWIFLLITLSLLIIAMWFIRKNYKHFYKGYKIDWNDKMFLLKLLWLLIKTSISFLGIIIMHNLYHDEQYVYMIFFGVVYISISILQSEYARVGFQSRIKFIFNYVERVFLKRKRQAQNLLKGLDNDEFDRYLMVVKVLLLIILFIIFLSQIGYFLLTNLVYVIIVSSFIILTFLLNNLIYFGFTSLVLLQSIPGVISFGSLNYYILSIAFVIIFIGMLFDAIFNQRICVITGNYYIKHVNFDESFNMVCRLNKIVVYQQQVNRMYYIHYRSVGYVLSFESYYDAKEYKSILRKMINSGKKFLVKNKQNLKKWL